MSSPYEQQPCFSSGCEHPVNMSVSKYVPDYPGAGVLNGHELLITIYHCEHHATEALRRVMLMTVGVMRGTVQ